MVNDLVKDSQLSVNVISIVNGLHTFFNIPKICEVYRIKHLEAFPKKDVKHLVA